LVAWAVWGLVAVAVWVTYARLPASQLYNVSGCGFAAGASRTLVFLDWPVALAAVALTAVAAERLLTGRLTRTGRIATIATGLAAVVLCATSGCRACSIRTTSTRGRPTARRRLASALRSSSLSSRSGFAGPAASSRSHADKLAVAAVPVLIALSVPWVMAGVGVSTGDIPVLECLRLGRGGV
jgi:hypothetical protein